MSPEERTVFVALLKSLERAGTDFDDKGTLSVCCLSCGGRRHYDNCPLVAAIKVFSPPDAE